MPEQDEANDEESPSENYCDFSVYIIDSHSRSGMIVDATSMDTEIQFNNLMVAEDM
jgi:hypothetical protein